MINLGLRGRFIAANLVVIVILVLTLAVMASRLFESYEMQSMEGQVSIDLERLAAHVRQSPGEGRVDFGASRGLVVPMAAEASLEPVLRDMQPGIHEDINVGGREFFAGRKDVEGYSLYVLLDAEPFELMEATMLRYTLYSLLAGAIFAIFVALWMSGQVLKPVAELSAWIGRIRPGAPRVPFTRHYVDESLEKMATTFEFYVDRLEDFVAREQALTEDVSHELRTPISVARSALTLLQEADDLPPLARQRLARIDRATRQMEELVESILFLAREDGGRCSGAVRLDELLGDVVESRQDAAARAGATIRVECAGPQTVIAHPGMVLSIIGNVLDNAIRHGGAGDIRVSLGSGRLSVADQGPGIEPERLEAVFSRKMRGDGSRGYGLGLHIVRNLCERLGWKITLQSNIGKGACVILEYPAV